MKIHVILLKNFRALYQAQVKKLGLTSQDLFSKQINKVVTLKNLKNSGDTIFFNSKTGSQLIVENYDLDFSNKLNITSISKINEQSSNVNIKGTLYWLSNERILGSGRSVRDGLLQDETGEMEISVLKKGDLIASIYEGTTYIMTDRTTKFFYGVKLETTRYTAI